MPLMGGLGPRAFPPEHGRTRTPSNRNIDIEPHAHAEPRLVQGIPPPPRHYPVQEFEAARPHSATALQTFYANQRFQTARPSETEQMMQAKRRLAAQRERELRNYHQEQQYNRCKCKLVPLSTCISSDNRKAGVAIASDLNNRVVSPSAISEDDRRDLINRQQRALYGENASNSDLRLNTADGQVPRPVGSNIPNGNTAPGTANSTRGPSPMSFDPFGLQNAQNGGNEGQLGNSGQDSYIGGANTTGNSPERSRTNSAFNPDSAFGWQVTSVAGVQPQSSRTSASSPTGGHDLGRVSTTPVTAAGVAPIGTRPTSQIQSNSQSPIGLQKRSTTPLPSPLSYGAFSNGNTTNNNNNNNNTINGNDDSSFNGLSKERTGSAQSNASASTGTENNNLGWKVWNNKPLGAVAGVWG